MFCSREEVGESMIVRLSLPETEGRMVGELRWLSRKARCFFLSRNQKMMQGTWCDRGLRLDFFVILPSNVTTLQIVRIMVNGWKLMFWSQCRTRNLSFAKQSNVGYAKFLVRRHLSGKMHRISGFTARSVYTLVDSGMGSSPFFSRMRLVVARIGCIFFDLYIHPSGYPVLFRSMNRL